VVVGLEENDLTDEEVAALSDTARTFREKTRGVFPTTLRILNDFDNKGVKEPFRYDGWSRPPMYVNP